jgi:hypothetical protein
MTSVGAIAAAFGLSTAKPRFRFHLLQRCNGGPSVVLQNRMPIHIRIDPALYLGYNRTWRLPFDSTSA